jgi:hypothetical protein
MASICQPRDNKLTVAAGICVQRRARCRLLQEVQGLSDGLPNPDRVQRFEIENVYLEKIFSISARRRARFTKIGKMSTAGRYRTDHAKVGTIPTLIGHGQDPLTSPITKVSGFLGCSLGTRAPGGFWRHGTQVSIYVDSS